MNIRVANFMVKRRHRHWRYLRFKFECLCLESAVGISSTDSGTTKKLEENRTRSLRSGFRTGLERRCIHMKQSGVFLALRV